MNVSDDQIDALKELINIGVGRAAGSLNQMCGAPIRLSVPSLRVVRPDSLTPLGGDSCETLAAVRMPFAGRFRGSADLIFPADSAAKLICLLTDEEDDSELDALRAATLTEVGNIVLNGVMGSMMNVLGDEIVYEVPTYSEGAASEISQVFGADSALLLAQTQFFIGRSQFAIESTAVTGEVSLVFGIEAFESLVGTIDELAGSVAS